MEKMMSIDKRSSKQPADQKMQENGAAVGQAAPDPSGAAATKLGTVIQVKIADLKPHPIAARIPRMSDDQMAAFEADVRQAGVQQPILQIRRDPRPSCSTLIRGVVGQSPMFIAQRGDNLEKV
jgi:hypothetical protein